MAITIVKDAIDIGLITGNLDAMTAFYCDTLGLEVEAVLDMPNGSQMTRLICGTTIVKLVTHTRTPEAKNPPGGIAGATGIRYFTITIDDLETAVAECRDAGYTVALGPLESRPGVNIAMIEDPDGNWVELLQHG